MTRKKVVYVIVEGPSDRKALGVLLSNIYENDRVHIYVTHGDITSDWRTTPANIVAKIGNSVKSYAADYYLKNKDFKEVIHIVDMDGAYISNSAIISDEEADKALYSTTEIHTCDREGIIERNNHKRANIERLKSLRTVWGNIPYSVYYMSCNLDHVLYNKLNSTDEEKENDADEFAEKYEDDVPGFLEFINESDFSVVSDYQESWEYITKEQHSLERHTNLGICFIKDKKIDQKKIA